MGQMNEGKRPAVFLDRDGVLCEDMDYVTDFAKLHIFPFAREAVGRMHEKGYLVVVVTNQSGVARGMMTEETVRQINRYLMQKTGVDDVFYCPHLPPAEESSPPYRILCQCRKPKPGMILEAAERWSIDLSRSYMVGDRESDLQTGRNAGLESVGIVSLKNDFENMETMAVFEDILMLAKKMPEAE